jgi:hypothetical protein
MVEPRDDLTLLKSQKNEVLLTIQASGMDPSDFELSAPASGRGTILTHFPSAYWFFFDENDVSFSPAQEEKQDTFRTLFWKERVSFLKDWLGYLKRELDAPDLWASLVESQELLKVEPAQAVNTPFNAEEQIHIKQAIEEIRVNITSTYSLAHENLIKVNRQLDYLIDASKRLGRIDWKNLFVGALITLALQELAPTGADLRQLLSVAGSLLRSALAGIWSPPLLH